MKVTICENHMIVLSLWLPCDIMILELEIAFLSKEALGVTIGV